MDELKSNLSEIKDERQQWKIHHTLIDILMIIIISVLAGHDEPKQMVIFAKSKESKLKEYLELKNGIPHHDTLKRVLIFIDSNKLHLIFYSWLAQIVTKKPQKLIDDLKRIIAFDGKTECGSDDIHNKALHILTAFDTDNELVLGQLPVSDKTNEITVMPDLLDLVDVKDTVVTADAMNCQYDIANKIIEEKGDYVLAIKGNKFDLYDDVVKYFDDKTIEKIRKNEQYLRTIEKAHSQIEKREYFLVDRIDFLQEGKGKEYKKLTSVGMILKTTENINTGEVKEERRYYINSIDEINLFAKAVRNHWKIENNLHWHLDFTLKEDHSTMIDKRIAFNLNVIRKFILSLLKKIDVGSNMSLKDKRIYIASNFNEFFDRFITQLESQV